VPAKRLIAHGFGSARPITDNETAAGRGKNERIEFVIYLP
jgi:flagellar motor protein MotB